MARTKHGCSNTRLYSIWKDMRRRCNNPNRKQYAGYGGRGIKVCNEWDNNFITFKEWAENNGYSDELTIDRINNNGNYEPGNCKWSTVKQQNNNTRQNVVITYNGETNTVSYFAEKLGLNTRTALWRAEQGLSVEDILSPIKEFSFKGHEHTEKSKQAMRDKLSGENSPYYGKHISEEAKKKISQSLKGRISPKRSKLSQETIEDILNLRNKGYSINKISQIVKYDRRIVKRTIVENGLD